MARPPIPPTFAWAVAEIESYLSGALSTLELFDDVSVLSSYYLELYPADVPSEDELYEFFGTVWGRSRRALEGKNSEQDLVELLLEWLPDMRRAAGARPENGNAEGGVA